MTDPHPGAAGVRPRPATVTISSYLLLLTALFFAISAVIGLATLGTVMDVYRDAYAGTSVAGAESVIAIFAVLGAVIQLLLAATFVVLAVLNNRGRNASRITTWVLGGLGVCCTGLNAGGSAFGNLGGGTTGGDLPNPDEVQRRLTDALPGWVGPVTTLMAVLSLLALLAVIILLALPASNAFFRKPTAGDQPPMPGAAYPPYPSYPGQQPPYPGSPGPGQQPPYPGGPGSGQQPPQGEPPAPPQS